LAEAALVSLICTSTTYRASDTSGVRWLDRDADYELVRAMWPSEIPLLRGDWEEAHDAGYRYCALLEEDRIVSIAAEWRYSDNAWETAAVRTLASCRRQGYGKRVVAFVTAHILTSGRVATCHTASDNVAMIRAALSVGYVPQEEKGNL
jgi:RimJ/RimL family protein N-acetyltransferase